MPKSKPTAVLLDANVIIESFRVSVWDAIVNELDIYIPSIVVNEVHDLPNSRKRNYVPVDLSPYIEKEQITRIEATVEELIDLKTTYDDVFLNKELHDGEEEALALANADRPGSALLCTSDGAAIQAIAMIDMRHKAISLEELLEKIGHTKRLRRQYDKAFLDENLEIGSIAMIMGTDLVPERKKKKGGNHGKE